MPIGSREIRKFGYHHSIIKHPARANVFAQALRHARCRPLNALASHAGEQAGVKRTRVERGGYVQVLKLAPPKRTLLYLTIVEHFEP